MKKIVFLTLAFFTVPFSVIAQTPLSSDATNVRGLEVGPFLIEAEVEKGASFQSQVDLINRSSSPLIITVTPRDFLPGSDGQPQFVPDTIINDPTFSLASWIKLKTSEQFTISPGQLVTVPFTLNPPINAEQGTHYGALLFSYVGSSATGNASEIQQSVGTIILVRYGEARENGLVELQSSRTLLFSADKVTLSNHFRNIGSVHVKPKGEVYIKNTWGKIISTPFINRDAVNVLPKTDRTFVNTWYPSSFAFGRYTAESVVVYGKGRLEARDKQVIWVLPWYFLMAITVVIVIILWVILHGRHWHRRRVLKRHFGES